MKNLEITIQAVGKKRKKNIVMLRNSIIKLIKGYKMSKKVGECTVFVKSFGEAKVRCLKDIMKTPKPEKPDHVILHVEKMT